MLLKSLFLNKFLPIDADEILNPIFDASILKTEIFLDDLDGIAKPKGPIRNAITINITAYSICYLFKDVLNNFRSFKYKTGINLDKFSTSIYFNFKILLGHDSTNSNK